MSAMSASADRGTWSCTSFPVASDCDSNASGASARSALGVCMATNAGSARGPSNLFFTRYFLKLTRRRDESRAPFSLKIIEL